MVQPRNAARNVCRCAGVRRLKLVMTDRKCDAMDMDETDTDIAGRIADEMAEHY
jgi:hypothetical protein